MFSWPTEAALDVVYCSLTPSLWKYYFKQRVKIGMESEHWDKISELHPGFSTCQLCGIRHITSFFSFVIFKTGIRATSSLWRWFWGLKESCREQTCGCQGGGGESGMDGEFGVRGCKLLHLEWISNELLLYSTGNYLQSLGIEHDGR